VGELGKLDVKRCRKLFLGPSGPRMPQLFPSTASIGPLCVMDARRKFSCADFVDKYIKESE